MVVGRVQISAITQPLKLAEPNQISFQSGELRVTTVRAHWSYYLGNKTPTPAFDDDRVLPTGYDSSGAASVSLTPGRLGKAQLTLFFSFEDGGVERQKIDLQVGPSERPPEKLGIASGGTYTGDRDNRPVIYLDLSDAHKTRDVDPAAVYKNVPHPVPLKASEVSFRFISPSGAEASIGTAAEIDPSTGIVTARYVGQALLETRFGGVATLTCIVVMEDIGKYSRSRCEELLPPGRRLPPSDMELDPRPPPCGQSTLT